MADAAIAVCQECGMPVRVLFDAAGNIEKVLAPCGHVKQEPQDALSEKGRDG